MPDYLEDVEVTSRTAEAKLHIGLVVDDDSAMRASILERDCCLAQELSRSVARSVLEHDLSGVLMYLKRALDAGEAGGVDVDIAAAANGGQRITRLGSNVRADVDSCNALFDDRDQMSVFRGLEDCLGPVIPRNQGEQGARMRAGARHG